jgi:peptide methionine sulfoxide reductase MsrB
MVVFLGAFLLCSNWSFANRNRYACRFRDQETNWEYVRCLANREAVSVDGTHLGHNLPDGRGSRYCINLVSVRNDNTSVTDSLAHKLCTTIILQVAGTPNKE